MVNEKRTEITNVPGLFMPLKPGYIQPNNNQQESSSNKQDKSSVTERNIHLTVNVSGIKSEEEARYVGKKVGRSAGMELIQMLKLGGRSE